MFARQFLKNVTTGARATRSAHTLVVAEVTNGKLNPATLSAVTAGAKLGPVDCIVASSDPSGAAESLSSIAGVSKVLTVSDATLGTTLPEAHAPVVASLAKSGGYTHVIAAATAFAKGVVPTVAGLLDVSPISDVTAVNGEDSFTRPIYAGNALETVKSSDAVKVISTRATAFEQASEAGETASVEELPFDASGSIPGAEFVSNALSESDKPQLAGAKVVVAGGRGMKSGDNFAMLDDLAETLNGAVGASRAAVDAGWVPNDLQIGQTGKIVAPDVYIAVGISGAIQHLAGMKDSKVIACINKDAEAPIFQVSDYGLVADLFDAVPELTSALK